MRIGYVQFDVARDDRAANLSHIKAVVRSADADLLVLPELCLTGYLFANRAELASVAETVDGFSVSELSSLAVECETTLVFGIAEKDAGRLFNTAIVATPDGVVASDRKCHLTTLEQQVFDSGSTVAIRETPVARVGTAMCFDGWFPERIRLLTRAGMQVLCAPSNFGGTDSLDVFRVRALENRVFVIVANRIGSEEVGPVEATFCGQSRIIGPDGVVLCTAGSDASVAVLDVDVFEADRKASVMSNALEPEWDRYQVSRTG